MILAIPQVQQLCQKQINESFWMKLLLDVNSIQYLPRYRKFFQTFEAFIAVSQIVSLFMAVNNNYSFHINGIESNLILFKLFSFVREDSKK